MRIQASSAGSIPITGTVLDIGRVSRSSLVHSLRGRGWDPEAGREAGRDAGGGPPLAATGATGSWVRLPAGGGPRKPEEKPKETPVAGRPWPQPVPQEAGYGSQRWSR